ncbi:MAG: helix-turn-helix transcriptional regulator [Bacteroidota bacterium]|nr:helix-turn-helix transcriptional regulator [Bacteroidota bacterium]
MVYLKHKDFLKKFGYRVREIRDKKLISQEELSFRTQLSRNQIGRIERGEINTGLSTVFEIALGLEVPIKDLFDF